MPEFDVEYGNTRKFIALVPDDKVTWKPHEKSMELGRLAWHLSDFPSWCRDTLNKDVLTFTDADGGKMMGAWKDKTHEQMLARFDGHLTEARAALAATSDDLGRLWRGRSSSCGCGVSAYASQCQLDNVLPLLLAQL